MTMRQVATLRREAGAGQLPGNVHRSSQRPDCCPIQLGLWDSERDVDSIYAARSTMTSEIDHPDSAHGVRCAVSETTRTGLA